MRGEAAGCTWLLAARDGWGTNPITTWLDVMLGCSKLINILASWGKASSACLWLQALVIPRSALSGVLWDSAFRPWGLTGWVGRKDLCSTAKAKQQDLLVLRAGLAPVCPKHLCTHPWSPSPLSLCSELRPSRFGSALRMSRAATSPCSEGTWKDFCFFYRRAFLWQFFVGMRNMELPPCTEKNTLLQACMLPWDCEHHFPWGGWAWSQAEPNCLRL